MDILKIFLLLILSCECAAQSLIQSSSVVTVEPGQTVKLSCTVKDDRIERLIVHWHRQQEENLQLVASLPASGTPRTVSGDFDRFVPSRNVSMNSLFLTISNVNKADEAEYYCTVWFTGSPGFVRGNGTWLLITTTNVSAPSVRLFPPSEDELSTEMGTICCLIKGFYPKFVEVLWSVDGDAVFEGVSITPPVAEEGDLYTVVSYLQVTATEWKHHTLFSCVVRHEPSSTTVKKYITSRPLT